MFLKRVYKEWKVLFCAILVFIVAQCFFMYKGIENVPFFLYSMFSTKHPHHDSIPVMLIKTRDGYVSPFEFSNRRAEMVTNNLAYYNAAKANRYTDGIAETAERRFKNTLSASGYQFVLKGLVNDNSALKKYPQWWAAYFKSVTNAPYDSVFVVKSYVYFQPVFHKSATDSVIFSVSLKE